MPTTLGTAAAAVRERLDESSARQWTDVSIRRWLQEGAKDAARRTFALMDQLDVTLVANTAEYTLSATLGPQILQINQVEWLPGGSDTRRIALRGRNRENMPSVWGHSQEQTRGEPLFYTVWGNPPALKLRLYPAPSINSTARLFIARLPTPLLNDGTNDGSNLDFPEGWVEILYDYCEYRALRKDEDPRWQESKQLYDENVQQMMTAADSYLRDNAFIVDEDDWIATRYQSLGFY